MSRSRIYSGSDVAMLTVCSVIVDNAIEDQDYLSKRRTGWQPPYFEEQKKKVEAGFTILGFDKTSGQRQATLAVLRIQKEALSELGDVKVQIEEDFRQDKKYRDELLNRLGYASFYRQASKKDQNALVELLYQFRENLTEGLRKEIEAKGTSPKSLELIIKYADQMKTANVTQEKLKGTSKTITEKDVTALNDIYSTVIGIARIAHRFYHGNPAKQGQYSYTKILNRLTSGGTKPEEEDTKVEE